MNPIFAPAGPAAHTLAQLGWFILILFVGYIYLLRKRALEWD